MPNRLRTTIIAAVAVTATFSSGVVAAQATATTHHSVAGVISHVTGKSVGPNSYTDWGKATITSFSSSYDCNRKRTQWTANKSYKQYPNPLAVRSISTRNALTEPTSLPVLSLPAALPTLCPSYTMGPDGLMHPDSWYNPTSWDWGGIMGWTWDNIFKKCLTGAAAGVVGTASGQQIVNLFTRGAKLVVGANGYAAIAIGGCVVNILF